MNNADMPAMPLPNDANGNPYVVTGQMNPLKAIGMTKREKFAMAAMQGLLPLADHNNRPADMIAMWAVEQADALLKALEESK